MKGYRRHGRRQPLESLLTTLCLLCVLVAPLGVLVSSCQAATPAKEEGSVQVEVRHVGFDQLSNSPVVILQDQASKKAIPIWVGAFEAQAIALELQGVPPPRPLTHDLVKTILDQVGVGFDKIVVSELKGSTYYARIYLTAAGKPLEVDSRPSDAIALALRFHRPIFVARGLLDSAFLPEKQQEVRLERSSVKVSGVAVQNLTPELAAYFNLRSTDGVLVADTGAEIGEQHLQRGDVIMAVEGKAVRDVTDFRDKLKKERGHPASLRVQRAGKELGVLLTPTEE
ncbi:MAG: bifunctional nuclease domain-containing protein [Candidatus Binatia bacterium]